MLTARLSWHTAIRIAATGETSGQGEEDVACRWDDGGPSGDVVVAYEEHGGDGAVRCELRLSSDGRVHITRVGELSSVLAFAAGERTAGEVGTPYGTVPLTVETAELLVQKDRQQLLVRVCYRILEMPGEEHLARFEIKGKELSQNNVRICAGCFFESKEENAADAGIGEAF